MKMGKPQKRTIHEWRVRITGPDGKSKETIVTWGIAPPEYAKHGVTVEFLEDLGERVQEYTPLYLW
jgi:hypothetical protein